jgi:hypothetical protein
MFDNPFFNQNYNPNLRYQKPTPQFDQGNQFNIQAPKLDWGSESLKSQVPGQFSAGNQLQAFNQTLPQQPQDLSPNTDKAEGIAGAVTTGIDLAGSAYAQSQRGKDIVTNFDGLKEDGYGNPVYDIGQDALATGRIKPRGANFGEVASATGKGLAAGAKFGVPGIIIGGAAGLVSSIGGGLIGKNREKKAKARATRNLDRKRGKYNEAYTTANEQRRSMQAYYDSINTQDRLNALYGNA